MRILIAESEGFSRAALARLRQRADVVTADLDRAGLLDAVSDVDILWVRLRHHIDEEIFQRAPKLRALVSNTTGLTHIDLAAAHARSVRVLSLRGQTDFLRTVPATAELTLALLLALVRHVPAACAHVRAGGWNRYPFQGHDLSGKVAGIVGYGRLGARVAGYLRAMGMHVIATTRDTDPIVDPVERLPLMDLLAAADVVTMHVDLNPQTHGMMDVPQFAAMKRGAWFINTSRGEVIDEPALLGALEGGHLGGAALDVLAHEHELGGTPRPLVQYAATHDNLLITPHIGGYTQESLARTEEFLAEELIAYLDHRLPESTAAQAVQR